MNSLPVLAEHHQVCDELHQLALDENRFLRKNQRPPDAAFLERKHSLLASLDRSLESLRTLPAASAREPEARMALEQSRARILQIMQLDRENEQLLLRCSLTSHRPEAAAAPGASPSMLQKIYSRTS